MFNWLKVLYLSIVDPQWEFESKNVFSVSYVYLNLPTEDIVVIFEKNRFGKKRAYRLTPNGREYVNYDYYKSVKEDL